jgi:hypothetical protein
MSKRFTQTEIWEEDWFLEMPKEYKLFWFYLKDQCNHAGIWKPNLKIFEAVNEVKIDLDKAFEYFNNNKERIQILNSGHWYIIDFFVFQYGDTFNIANRVHESIEDIYIQEGIDLSSIRGLIVLKDRVKDKDKDSISIKSEDNIKTWRNDIAIYKAELREAYNKLTTDTNYIKERQRYHPNLDITNTIEKACRDYWSTEAGWKNKKVSRSKTIDWKATFNNALSNKMNWVWRSKEI